MATTHGTMSPGDAAGAAMPGMAAVTGPTSALVWALIAGLLCVALLTATKASLHHRGLALLDSGCETVMSLSMAIMLGAML